MSFQVVTVLQCDGKEHGCEERLTAVGTSKRSWLLDNAALRNWRFYSRSHFCPGCWAEITKILKIRPDNHVKPLAGSSEEDHSGGGAG